MRSYFWTVFGLVGGHPALEMDCGRCRWPYTRQKSDAATMKSALETYIVTEKHFVTGVNVLLLGGFRFRDFSAYLGPSNVGEGRRALAMGVSKYLTQIKRENNPI